MAKEKPWVYFKVGSLKVKVDAEDVPKLEKHSWRVTEGTTGRRRVVTSIRTPEGVRTLTLGRFLMKPSGKKQVYPRRFQSDLDYRKDNLIVCTLKERQRLLPKNRKSATSKYRGVSQAKGQKKWRAAIEVNGQTLNLGLFASESQAALAYNEAARKHFGDIAYQNQVRSASERRKK